MKRIVCDTNVIVSGFMFSGNERELIRRIIKGEYVNYTSRPLILEFASVIARRKFGLDETEQERMIKILVDSSLTIETKTRIHAIKEDLADNRVLECAVDSQAGYIISGDQHLLKLGKYKGITIKTAGDLLKE